MTKTKKPSAKELPLGRLAEWLIVEQPDWADRRITGGA